MYNLDKNAVTHTYLGYCPPYDDINPKRLGAKKRRDDVDGVMVIYVQKLEKTNDREIIAFTDNATVYGSPKSGKRLDRKVFNKGKNEICSYTIESDEMYSLVFYPKKFYITVKEYGRYVFRRQRFYKGKYPELDKKIIAYLEDYLSRLDADEDFEFQKDINDCDDSESEANDTANVEPEFTNGASGMQVAKKPGISKYALKTAKYKCAADAGHKTFMTTKNLPYMEGHHLIPCTADNAKYFWEEKHVNIDCVENIVCLCPTCHRRIHYGSKEEREEILTLLYHKQIKKLKSVGLDIKLEELMELYD